MVYVYRLQAFKNWIFVAFCTYTVNPEIFARILSSRIALKYIFAMVKIVTRHDLPISVNDSGFGILRGFYLHETLHMQNFAKIKPSRKSLNVQ